MGPGARAALVGGRDPVCVRFLSAALLATLSSTPALAQQPTPQIEHAEATEATEAEPVVPGQGALPSFGPRQEIMGSLDRGAIDGIIRTRSDALREAYDERLRRKPRLAGRLVVHFTIEQGVVTDASITRSTLQDGPFEASVVSIFRSLSFDPALTASVSYPLVFQP